MNKASKPYHHGNLAESLLDAVDELATQFGLEAVTLRACAKKLGVSPSSAFRHYADKRALFTAFATRAIHQLAAAMESAKRQAETEGSNPFFSVGLAYVRFGLEKPAFFRAMWREEAIYSQDEAYQQATRLLASYLQGGFVATIEDDDPEAFSSEELLAWSAVHGLTHLFVDGPVGCGKTIEEQVQMAADMLVTMNPLFRSAEEE
ncbi:MAG TPA: TetR/AcrR family transcriptional regulator [Gammaproteobacteria bacterium]|nr:TetR/AcrR family transcriptional regulator [Gammaproteobacteria bacterium]